MVYLLAFTLTGNLRIAALASLLFIIHPTHVEAIVWLSSRKDLVAAAFAIPAAIAYYHYRRMLTGWRAWYAASVGAFVLAIGGKQSVVILPVLLWCSDVMLERRPLAQTWLDKIPYVAIAVFFALKTLGAQPLTREAQTLVKAGYTLCQNLWLLTGLGDYVIYRERYHLAADVVMRWLYGVVPLAIPVAMWFLRHKINRQPLFLICWVAIAMIPLMGMSFIHPVIDRYLFFPSVAWVILIAYSVGPRLRLQPLSATSLVAMAMVVALGALWTYKSWSYIADWNDPRSVWYSATLRAERDCNNFFYLANHYHNNVMAIDALTGKPKIKPETIKDLATLAWRDHPQLSVLHGEIDERRAGKALKEFRIHLLKKALGFSERALELKGREVMPNLYFRRGMILMELNRYDEAWQEFEASLRESQKHTYKQIRESLAVYCHQAMGYIRMRQKNYQEAYRWLKLADEEQDRFKGHWIPNLKSELEKVEKKIKLNSQDEKE